jgi:hypothetical protein
VNEISTVGIIHDVLMDELSVYYDHAPTSSECNMIAGAIINALLREGHIITTEEETA